MQAKNIGLQFASVNKLVQKLYEALLDKDMTLQQTLEMFDQDGDGKVSAAEFREVFKKAHPDLPIMQVCMCMYVYVCVCVYERWRWESFCS